MRNALLVGLVLVGGCGGGVVQVAHAGVGRRASEREIILLVDRFRRYVPCPEPRPLTIEGRAAPAVRGTPQNDGEYEVSGCGAEHLYRLAAYGSTTEIEEGWMLVR